MSNRPTRKDILRQRKTVTFVGRERQLELFQTNLDRNPEHPGFHFIFNVFGQGGVGKSTLLERYRELSAGKKAYAVYVDVRPNLSDSAIEPVQLLGEIAAQFKAQESPLDKLEKQHKLYRQQKQQLEADPDAPKGFFSFFGKTAVKIALREAKKVPGFGAAVEFVDEDAAGEQLGEWASFVKKKLTNKDEVRLVLEPEEVLTPLLVEELADLDEKRQIILFVDNYEAAGKDLDAWLRRLLGEEKLPLQFVLVVAGREPLDPNAWSGHFDITQPVSVEPFSEEEARDYLTRKCIADPAVVSDILHLSGRLPVLLSFLAEVAPGEAAQGDPSDLAVERFLKWVDDPAKRSLALHAALPRSFNRDVLAALTAPGEDADALFDWLLRMPFVHKKDGAWAYHAVVREMMMRHIRQRSPKEFSSLHQRLADHFAQQRDDLGLPPEKTWKDEDWVKWELESLLHRLVASPKKCLAEGVSGFVEAMMNGGNRLALQWGETFQQAGSCAKDETLKGWGLQMCRAMEESKTEKNDLEEALFTAILDQRLVEKADVRGFCWFVKGFCFAEKGDYDAAIEAYRKAVEFKPDFHEAWYNMGIAWYQKGDLCQTIECYGKVVEYQPDHYEAWIGLGWCYFLTAKLQEAKEALEQCRKWSEDKHPDAPMNLGHVHLALGEREAALACYRRSLELYGDKAEFFKGMEGDWQHLVQYGIGREVYEAVLAELQE